jgi:hypothetical protein
MVVPDQCFECRDLRCWQDGGEVGERETKGGRARLQDKRTASVACAWLVMV